MRLDKYCTQFMDSRVKAQDAIKNGRVSVNGKVIKKASFAIEKQDKIEIEKDIDDYVSRAAYKLLGAIETFSISLKNLVVLDIGASTGGFTDVCLRQDAKKVYALDVGHLQLSSRLEKDGRVIKMEGRNARYLEKEWFDETIDFICMDVSFIQAKTILDRVFEVLDISSMVILIKPQFECGPSYLNKQGILKDKKIAKKIVENYRKYFYQHYPKVDIIESPIQGRGGNQEYVVYARK